MAQLADSIIQAGINTINSLINGFSSGIDSIKGFFSDLGSTALNILNQIANAIQNWVLDKIQWAMDGINNLRNLAGSILDGIGSGISNAYTNMTQANNIYVESTNDINSAIDAVTGPYFYRK